MTEARTPVALEILPTPLAIVRLPGAAPIPDWVSDAASFLSMTRTAGELSVVTDAATVPAGLRGENRYLAFRVQGPMPLALVGVMAALAEPLAAAGIPILPIGTFDTDYILVRDADVAPASRALAAAGHQILPASTSRGPDR